MFTEYLKCVTDSFGSPYDDRKIRPDGEPTLREVSNEFSISIPKARKLLITAGFYSTELSRKVIILSEAGKSIEEIVTITGLSRSSVGSYLPYKKFSYNMDKASRHAEDSWRYRNRKKMINNLHEKIIASANTEDAFWQAVIAYQGYPLYTSSGLPFLYTVKRNRAGEYSGELVINRKKDSKTLTRSSIMLAFHKVEKQITIKDIVEKNGSHHLVIVPLEYKGPKAIGDIFGISYMYSLFWKLGLIKVPAKVENKLIGKR